MTLGRRLMFTLVAITVILIAPAVYGLFALRDLRDIADDLSTRDAQGALALGRLQTAFSQLDNQATIFHALATDPEGRTAAAQRVGTAMIGVETELQNLRQGGYEAAAREAEENWALLRDAVRSARQPARPSTPAAAA